jgi:hypothetical protein
VQHASAEVRERRARTIPHVRHEPRRRRHARIGGVDAVHVGQDLAAHATERRRERHRRGVAAAAAERGDLLGLGRHALEAGHDHHLAGVERGTDAIRLHAHDARARVALVGQDAALRAGERDGVHPQIVERHGHERHGHAFAGGHQHVQLAARRVWRDLVGERDQLVGGVAHGAHHHDHRVTRRARGGDARGHGADAIRSVHRRAAVFLDEDVHAGDG